MQPDLTYRKDGMLTTFYAETEAGQAAWNVIASKPEGMNGKILTIWLDNVLRQLRKAGYVVRKAKPVAMSDDELLAELLD